MGSSHLHGSGRLNRFALIAAVGAVVAYADAITKHLAVAMLSPSTTVTLTPFLNLRLTQNTGISFGFFQAESTTDIITLIAIQCAVIGGLLLVAARSSMRLEQAAIALILGAPLPMFLIGQLSDQSPILSISTFMDGTGLRST